MIHILKASLLSSNSGGMVMYPLIGLLFMGSNCTAP